MQLPLFAHFLFTLTVGFGLHSMQLPEYARLVFTQKLVGLDCMQLPSCAHLVFTLRAGHCLSTGPVCRGLSSFSAIMVDVPVKLQSLALFISVQLRCKDDMQPRVHDTCLLNT